MNSRPCRAYQADAREHSFCSLASASFAVRGQKTDFHLCMFSSIDMLKDSIKHKALKMPGYSGTPLAKKLGIKAGFRIKTKNAPSDYLDLISPLPENVNISTGFRSNIDLWHVFTATETELENVLTEAPGQIKQNGMIWVSWPKKSSGVPSEITEDTVRFFALPLGLVDVKVCAVDDTWSGLKLVIRKANRCL